MVRPSRNDTEMLSSVKSTVTTRSSAVNAKMPIPSLQELVQMSCYQRLYSSEFDCAKPKIPGQCDRVELELRREIVSIYVDMRRFVWLMTVKIGSIRPRSKHCRH